MKGYIPIVHECLEELVRKFDRFCGVPGGIRHRGVDTGTEAKTKTKTGAGKEVSREDEEGVETKRKGKRQGRGSQKRDHDLDLDLDHQNQDQMQDQNSNLNRGHRRHCEVQNEFSKSDASDALSEDVASGDCSEVVDILQWMNYLAFDVLSDLAFGNRLGMVKMVSDDVFFTTSYFTFIISML